jgi:tRNA nucleotidyltransferase (CCA-adding enzyme)
MNFKHYIHTHLFEANEKIPNWDKLVAQSEELSIGVELLKKLQQIDPEGEALIVGGAVRDIVLGKEPKDVDIATNIDLDKIEQSFKTNDIGKSKDFGIALVHYKGEQYEIAGYRTEGEYTDKRRPDTVTLVKDFKSDAARRDLTINAMGVDADGVIYDYFGGIEDIQNKTVRTVRDAEERFNEDALRVLRAPRFAAALGFELTDEVKAAMTRYPIKDIAQERITQELKKAAVSGESLAKFIELLDETELLEPLFPWISDLKGLKQNPIHHPEADDTYGHVLAAVRASQSNDPLTNLAILFHDIGKGRANQEVPGEQHLIYHGHDKKGGEMVRSEIGPALKLSSKETDAIATACDLHMLMHKIKELNQKKVMHLVDNPHWEILKAVTYADEMSRLHLADEQQYFDKIQYAEDMIKQHGDALARKNRVKEFIDGNKLMQWIPDLTQADKKHYMGLILNATADWLVKNQFNQTPEQVRQHAIDLYNRSQSADNFEEFWDSYT